MAEDEVVGVLVLSELVVDRMSDLEISDVVVVEDCVLSSVFVNIELECEVSEACFDNDVDAECGTKVGDVVVDVLFEYGEGDAGVRADLAIGVEVEVVDHVISAGTNESVCNAIETGDGSSSELEPDKVEVVVFAFVVGGTRFVFVGFSCGSANELLVLVPIRNPDSNDIVNMPDVALPLKVYTVVRSLVVMPSLVLPHEEQPSEAAEPGGTA